MLHAFWSCYHGSMPMTGPTMLGTSLCTFFTCCSCQLHITQLMSNWLLVSLLFNGLKATHTVASHTIKQSKSPTTTKMPRATEVSSTLAWGLQQSSNGWYFEQTVLSSPASQCEELVGSIPAYVKARHKDAGKKQMQDAVVQRIMETRFWRTGLSHSSLISNCVT